MFNGSTYLYNYFLKQKQPKTIKNILKKHLTFKTIFKNSF